MSDSKNMTQPVEKTASGRRAFLYTIIGGLLASITGWIAGAFPKPTPFVTSTTAPDLSEARISSLEAKVAQLAQQLIAANNIQSLAQLEGEMNERVIFHKSELTVSNPEGVLLNLVATDGHVGIRFYKDFGFGNEQVTNPWHMGWIEGKEGYQGLAILRDWKFTAALWDEDGKLLLGRLHPHPPSNDPARARFHVRGTLDEVQAIIEGSTDQTADIFQVLGGEGTKHLAVNGAGQVVVGSRDDPKEIILHDTQDKRAYSLKVTNGQITLTRI